MKIHYRSIPDSYSGIILLPVYETAQKSLVPISYGDIAVSAHIFYGKKDSSYAVEKDGIIYIFIGLGKKPDYKSIRVSFRRVANGYKENYIDSAAIIIPDAFTETDIEAAISGLLVGAHDIGQFKKNQPHPFKSDDFELLIYAFKDISDVVQSSVKLAAAQSEVFRMIDLPPNVATPEYLAEWAKTSGTKFGFSTTVLDRQQSKDAGLHAFASVAQGSVREPQFIIMEYKPAHARSGAPHVGLVGKGITFDTGGLNIKTAGMLHMKCDMGGGAAVLGCMQLIADLQLPVHVTAIVPCCENSVSSRSYYPGDVINSYSGHSIEIIDTDAEGRLILADGLSYLVKNFKPDTIIDVATLTGSSVATFGYECAAFFCNDDKLASQMQRASEKTMERIWPLPLWDVYDADIQSDIADVRNFSGKPVAGAISAAKFLQYFTDKHTSWAHLDIAGVAFIDDEFSKSKHATAYGVNLLTNFIKNL